MKGRWRHQDTRSDSWQLGLLAEGLILLPGLVSLVLLLFQVGPWLWLVELQLAMWGVYYGNYTAGVYFLLTWGMMAFVYGALRATEFRGRPVLAVVPLLVLENWACLPRWLGWLPVLPVGLGIILLSVGMYNLGQIVTAGPRSPVEAAQLEAGARLPSRWLVIRGRPLLDQPLVWTKKEVIEARTFAVVSERWQAGQPIGALVHFRGSKNPRLPQTGDVAWFEGLVSVGQVPGLTRSSFEKMGLRLSDQAVLIVSGDTPDTLWVQASIELLAGVVLLPAGLVLLFVLAWFYRGDC